MPVPSPDDLINIHTHGSVRCKGVFAIENLMLHEGRRPDESADAFSAGIHPWFLNEEDFAEQLEQLSLLAYDDRIVAIGEAGYDRRRGPDTAFQHKVFEAQAAIAAEAGKPLMIHCVKGYDELWASMKSLKPSVPWIIHGFNGSTDQAIQLIGGGFYLSLWVKSVLNGSLDEVMRAVPADHIFLETDGFDVEVKTVYDRAAQGCNLSTAGLINTIHSNYQRLFCKSD